MAKVTKVITEDVIPEGAVNDTEQFPDPAEIGFGGIDRTLFKNAGIDPKKVPGGIGVTRLDPPDGYLGYFPANTSKEDLKRLVGGYVLSLDLKDGLGRRMPGCTEIIVKIDAPPVASAQAREAAQELKRNGTAANGLGADQFARILDLQRTAIDEVRTHSQNGMAMLRAELEGAQSRRQTEADATIRRMQEDAKIRADEADAKHRRELELQRTHQESSLQREREQRASDEKRHTEMIAMIQNNNAQQTQVVVASMANKTDAMSVIKEMMVLAAPLLPMLSGQGDPAVEITKAVSTSLESMTKLALTDKPADGKEIQRSNGGASKGEKPSANAQDKKTRLLAKVGQLFQSVHGAGHDPEVILDQAIAHYTKEKQLQEQAEGDEGDDATNDGQTQEHAPKRTKRRPRSGPVGSRVARRSGRQSKAASQPPVGHRAKEHGRPATQSSARRDPAGSKRNRKA